MRYYQLRILDRTHLCFHDDVYLCLCADNSTRVECFLYDDQLARCSHCLAKERC